MSILIVAFISTSPLYNLSEKKSWPEITNYLQQLLIITHNILFYPESNKQTSIRVQNFINEHILQNINLTTLSKEFSYTPSYLSHIFHEQTGETIIQYITSQKVKVINNLLKNKNYSINEIVSITGFKSRAYFNRFIKKNTGMTPQMYRKKILAK